MRRREFITLLPLMTQSGHYYRQIGRLRALRNLVNERGGVPEHVGKVHPIAHHAATDGDIGPPARRQTLLQSERGPEHVFIASEPLKDVERS